MSLRVSTKRFQLSKRLVTFVAIFALLVQPMYTLVASRTASALGVDYTPAPFVLGEWATDRAAPTGGHGIIDFAGRANTLEMSLNKDLANMSGTGFYQTEGLKRTVALGTTALKANLYVDSDWIANGKTVRAGLWGTAQNSTSAVSAYPIVEFTTDGHIGWRSYNTVTGTWNNSAAAYNVDAWNTLEIQLDVAANQFTYLVNNEVIGTAQLNGSVSVKDVILNSKNYGATAQSYSVRWSDFHTGAHVASAITNLTTLVVYDDLQAAIDAAASGDTLRLNEDLTTTNQSTITKPVTINGNGYTIFNSRDNSVKNNSNNSVIGVQSNDVTLNNLTIDGTDGVWMHGINVYEAKNVAINNTTLKNNSNAGLIVGKDSEVKINNITTSGNGWYGINVDKKTGTSATLTVNGVSTHDEDATAHIYIDDRDATGNTVNDPGLQYVRYWKNAGYQYLLDRSKPTVTSTIAAENPTEFSVHATDDQRLIRIDYSIWNKDRTVQIGVWGQNIDGHVKVFDKTLTEYRVGTTAAYKTLTELPDGEYQLNVTVGDVRGKSTNATVAYFKIGDFTAPTASITVESPAGTGSLHRNIVKVTGSVGATDTDIKSHWIEIKNPDGSLSYSYNMNTTSLTHSFDLDTSKGDGEYRIRYVATDRDGNRSDRSGDTIRVIMVDNSAPVITDIATIETPTSITVSGKTDSPDRPVFVTLDGDTREAIVDPTTGEWTITFTGLTSDAPYPFTVRSADAVGNVFESSAPARTAVAVVTGGRQVTAEVPVVDDEDDDQTNFIAFLPATFGGLGVNDDAAVTPLLPATPAADGDDEPDVLGAEDTKANWSVVNAALAGFIAILAVVALAGIRRNEADNNTGARLFMIVPAAVAVIAFFLIEDVSGSMAWFNVWTWLFAGILVVQAILATLTTRTAND